MYDILRSALLEWNAVRQHLVLCLLCEHCFSQDMPALPIAATSAVEICVGFFASDVSPCESHIRGFRFMGSIFSGTQSLCYQNWILRLQCVGSVWRRSRRVGQLSAKLLRERNHAPTPARATHLSLLLMLASELSIKSLHRLDSVQKPGLCYLMNVHCKDSRRNALRFGAAPVPLRTTHALQSCQSCSIFLAKTACLP